MFLTTGKEFEKAKKDSLEMLRTIEDHAPKDKKLREDWDGGLSLLHDPSLDRSYRRGIRCEDTRTCLVSLPSYMDQKLQGSACRQRKPT